MKERPLISVIVPVYKVEAYLDKCIYSIINQTYKDLEIILIDDGSPDKCGEMCDSWACRDSRIKVVHKMNGGLSSARNAGLDVATGEWVGFVDSDDYIMPDMYEMLQKETSDENVDVVTGNLIYVDSNGNKIPPSLKWDIDRRQEVKAIDTIKPLLEYKFPHSVCLSLFRRSSLLNLNFVQNEINEDLLFVGELLIKMALSDKKIVLIPKDIYYYVANPKGICGNAQKLDMCIVKHKFQISKSFFKNFSGLPDAKKLYSRYSINFIEYMNNFMESSSRTGANRNNYVFWSSVVKEFSLSDFEDIDIPLGYKINYTLQKTFPNIFFAYLKARCLFR